MNIKINHATQKTQRQTHGPTGLCELFLLTVPIAEVARCQYKTVQIIFLLNLQTVTITLDVVKWRGGGFSFWRPSSPDPVQGFCPWIPLGDFRYPDPMARPHICRSYPYTTITGQQQGLCILMSFSSGCMVAQRIISHQPSRPVAQHQHSAATNPSLVKLLL